ncbi:MAG: hypothetical protein IPG45_27030 [Deltaproteobacteria bacterium]|nr:hypothetical protein [Deltaproteobacteria bacterium]
MSAEQTRLEGLSTEQKTALLANADNAGQEGVTSFLKALFQSQMEPPTVDQFVAAMSGAGPTTGNK